MRNKALTRSDLQTPKLVLFGIGRVVNASHCHEASLRLLYGAKTVSARHRDGTSKHRCATNHIQGLTVSCCKPTKLVLFGIGTVVKAFHCNETSERVPNSTKTMTAQRQHIAKLPRYAPKHSQEATVSCPSSLHSA
jgi:hypothetical protein